VVFLHGSGSEGRWASRYLGTQLATHGIAALIFDKRGVGGSTGDWRRATLDDLAGDGVAAVARLLQEPRIAAGASASTDTARAVRWHPSSRSVLPPSLS